ncbi:MAG: aryl-sulfate sulfohydrolase [Sphingobacteriaceae bacterium]|jgi:arylsulfatase A-like enzyme|nr:aryl-sulfate sulfohydrolase [Sphingobacteriaceae bacterium]
MKKIFGLLLATFVFAGFSAVAQKSPKTNILFIFADDLGYKDVGFTGGDYYETPNIDKLSKEGMVFNNAYSGGANCAPSRACLISGQYTPRHGVYAVGTTDKGPIREMRLMPIKNTQHLSPANFTMADALRTAGYATGVFGKWHIGDEKDNTDPLNQGFDVAMDANGPKKVSVLADPKAIFQITDSACNFIKRNKDKPFFAYVSHHAVHGNHQARAATLAKFKAKAHGKNHGDPLFAACVYDFDEAVGKVLACLKEQGLEKNTLVIFTSDNGGTSGSSQEPLRGNKGSFYEGGIREPYIVRWPGIVKPGTHSDTPIINLDLYPTFAALAGAKIPADKILDGESLLPIFKGQQTSTKRDKLFWHFPGYLDRPVIRGRDSIFRTKPVTTMRKGDYKIMLYHEEWQLDGGWAKRATNNSVEMFNLKTDPGERNNIANKNPQKRDELLTDLQAWMKKVNAPMATIRTPAQEAMKLQPQKKRKKSAEDDD